MNEIRNLDSERSIFDFRADFLVLPKEIREIVKKHYGLDVEHAYVIAKSISPKEFQLGEGKEGYFLEFGVLAVRLGKKDGYMWCCDTTGPSDTAQYLCHKCKQFEYIKTKPPLKSSSDKKLYCCAGCKKGL